MKKIYIIHGWGYVPAEEPWYQWLKKEMENKGWSVTIPTMPDPENPQINLWVNELSKIVFGPDEETYFVGHSIGAQTILRYLEKLPENIKIGGCVFVAPWLQLNPLEGPEEEAIAKPWVETLIDFAKVKTHCEKFVAIFSNNDPFVPKGNEILFADRLNARIATLVGQGHFSADEGVEEIPAARDALLSF